MEKFVRLGLVLMAILVPVLAFAAPANVTNIRTLNENGRVRLTWNQVSGDVSAYHVYYSHQSILDNGGTYDDFEVADGTTNTYLLAATPTSNDVFVSILAVDGDGVESPYFVEESKLTLQASNTSSSSSIASSSSSSAAPTATSISLLSIESLSATGVLLKFSGRVVIPDEQAIQAISIKDASGSTLALTKLVIQGNTVEVHTVPQARGKAYVVRVTNVVTGLATNGSILPLASDQQPILFTGHATGTAPVQTSSASSASGNADYMDVTNLRVTADAGTNSYTVTATWQPPAQQGVIGYELAQSTDGGRTFGEARQLNAETYAANISNVPPSDFGIRVRAMFGAGAYSEGATQTIRLASLTSTPSTPVTGSVGGGKPDGKGSGALPNSGPALWLAIIALMSASGTWALRVHKARQA